MKLREGWYFASLGGASIECVWVRQTRSYDQNREPDCPFMAESVGYSDPMPVNRFEFFGRVRMPAAAKAKAREGSAERLRELLASAPK